MKTTRWIVVAALFAGCGGGKAAPKPATTSGPDAGPVVEEEPEAPPDAEEAQLDVTGLMPTNGPPGTVVVIHGSAFTKDDRGVKVYFGAKQASISSITDTEITVEAPKGVKGEPVDVVVRFEPGGEVRLQDGYTYPE